MPNPIKGEGVEIEISGKSYPLIFTFDAIAKIEAEFDQLITEIQARLPRAGVMVALLKVALVGFEDDLMEAEIPPVIETQLLIQKAIHIAYFGAEATKEFEKADKKAAKKKGKSPKK